MEKKIKGNSLSYRDRLKNKTVKQLKAIYIRCTGKDLLRGNKQEIICSLASYLDSSRRWQAISTI